MVRFPAAMTALTFKMALDATNDEPPEASSHAVVRHTRSSQAREATPDSASTKPTSRDGGGQRAGCADDHIGGGRRRRVIEHIVEATTGAEEPGVVVAARHHAHSGARRQSRREAVGEGDDRGRGTQRDHPTKRLDGQV
eukprot:6868949-Prymnesium_polylepis.3